MHARVLGVGKVVVFRELSSAQRCPHRERGSTLVGCFVYISQSIQNHFDCCGFNNASRHIVLGGTKEEGCDTECNAIAHPLCNTSALTKSKVRRTPSVFIVWSHTHTHFEFCGICVFLPSDVAIMTRILTTSLSSRVAHPLTSHVATVQSCYTVIPVLPATPPGRKPSLTPSG